MTTADYALITSILALVVSIFALLWNVRQKFIFVKPTLQAGLGVYNTLKTDAGGRSASPSGHRLLVLNVTNMGPGPVVLYGCIAEKHRRV